MTGIEYRRRHNAILHLLILDAVHRKARWLLAAPVALMHGRECGFDVSPERVGVEQCMRAAVSQEL